MHKQRQLEEQWFIETVAASPTHALAGAKGHREERRCRSQRVNAFGSNQSQIEAEHSAATPTTFSQTITFREPDTLQVVRFPSTLLYPVSLLIGG